MRMFTRLDLVLSVIYYHITKSFKRMFFHLNFIMSMIYYHINKFFEHTFNGLNFILLVFKFLQTKHCYIYTFLDA